MTIEYEFSISTSSEGLDTASYLASSTTSRAGASCRLARQLVSEGAADGTLHLLRDGKRVLSYKSLHSHAQRTFRENDKGIRFIKWRPSPFAGDANA
ncbi:hypothetical protein C0V97_12360 [Asaia sp. W19]|nr:hypothetical protein C0V97_12360 [Asaia sp. W19]